jgi:hypothetical protein
MVIIQVQVGNNFIEGMFQDGGFAVNIITKKLRVQLGLSKPKLHLITYIWLMKPLQNP